MNNKIKLSQCMIVKNEEKNIEQALRWAKNITFEQIVVDTGSTDRTVEIAKKMGAKVYHFEWINDFSAAKNFAIEQATGDWITTLDADEYMEKQDSRNLLTVLELISKDKGLAKKCKAISSKIINTNDDGSFGISFYTVRVFKNDPSIRFKGRIHEELTLETSSIIKVNDFNIIHTGYTTEAKVDKDKTERNIKMLREELKQNPNNMNILAYLADSLQSGDENNKKEAIELYEAVIKSGKDVHNLLKIKAYNAVISKYLDSGDDLSKCEALCKNALEEIPGLIDFEYFMGYVLNQKGEYKNAWEILEKAEQKLQDKNYYDESLIIPSNQMLLYNQIMLSSKWMMPKELK